GGGRRAVRAGGRGGRGRAGDVDVDRGARTQVSRRTAEVQDAAGDGPGRVGRVDGPGKARVGGEGVRDGDPVGRARAVVGDGDRVADLIAGRDGAPAVGDLGHRDIAAVEGDDLRRRRGVAVVGGGDAGRVGDGAAVRAGSRRVLRGGAGDVDRDGGTGGQVGARAAEVQGPARDRPGRIGRADGPDQVGVGGQGVALGHVVGDAGPVVVDGHRVADEIAGR